MKDSEKSTDRITKSVHIPFSQLSAYGAGGIIPIALFNVAGILVGLMGNISLGLSAFWLGFILIIPRLWDAFTDPIIGHLSDNTRSRWGRRRPWMVCGALLSALIAVLMWYPPTSLGPVTANAFVVTMFVLLYTLGYSLFTIPYTAQGYELSTDYSE